ncbi:MAG: SDR family oxidoreductase [Capsulimonas sp.]|uniref:SDR family NAD(P)-dependent oxidoreductase n=1 Tax=Capsulimonas sp. TaxID=2494211 RepID=UPI003262D609
MSDVNTGLTLDLSGKVCVVTGATGELGRVMTRTLARCGADVAINYLRNVEMAETLVREVREMGRRAIAVQADVTDKTSVNAMRDQISAELGVADVIVNNAVIQYDWTSVLEQSVEDYESQFRSCVLHNVLMAQAFTPAMIERGTGGRVIGINTECAMQNFAGQSAYVAGKRGMDGILRILAKEIGEHQITVNQVAPGWMISDRDRASGTEENEGYASKVPLKRRGTDQDIANVVAFLASDLSGFITGAYIPVCGGNVMPAI